MPHSSRPKPNRPLDRGEHEGLPALTDSLRDETPRQPEPSTLDVPKTHGPPLPRQVRWLLEAALLLGLIGYLAFLLTDVAAHPPKFSRPDAGVSPADRQE